MKKTSIIFLTIITLAFFSSCKTLEVEDIPQDMTAAQLIQAGQAAFTAGNYKNSETYFSTAILRYGMDTAIYLEARYELGNLYYKQKKYDKARVVFNEIIDIYESGGAYQVSQAYNKLARIGLSKLPAPKQEK